MSGDTPAACRGSCRGRLQTRDCPLVTRRSVPPGCGRGRSAGGGACIRRRRPCRAARWRRRGNHALRNCGGWRAAASSSAAGPNRRVADRVQCVEQADQQLVVGRRGDGAVQLVVPGLVDAPFTRRPAGADAGAHLVRQANWQKVGGASPPERRSNRTTFLREPCVGSREGAGEASVAAWMGRAIEHRKSDGPGCRGFQIGRRQYCRRRFGEMSASPAVSENPCTFARLLLGPWEVFKLPRLS